MPTPKPVHPIAALFPLKERAALYKLAADTRKHGLREPIIRYQGLILDGRNRLDACLIAGVAPSFVEFNGGYAQALDLVVSRKSERAASKIAKRQDGRTDLADLHNV